ncbi:hypothetical protein [Brevibacillus sp. HB1.4B]|uniref:hypothetical protein n=1 Tax=Brevibacillus sp. HB1.4B TaxID=2738845 RepID=UPI0020C1F92D|nr:hypothetical protein [Brevibacillus sp. HB1.4B]
MGKRKTGSLRWWHASEEAEMSVSTPKSGTSTKSHPMGGGFSAKRLVDKRVPLFSVPTG